MRALTRPTRRKARKKKGCARTAPRTVEEISWPDEARVLSIMAHGFTYDEAWHMGWRDYHRYAGLAAAWSIPADERDGLVVRGTDTSHLV